MTNPIEITTDLLDEFSCQVCFDLLSVPYRHCGHEHFLCQPCVDRLNSVCPFCLQSILGMPARKLMDVAHHLGSRCEIQNCGRVIRLTNLRSHDQDCNYRVHGCPISSNLECAWNGRSLQTWAHLVSHGPSAVLDDPETEITIGGADEETSSFFFVIITAFTQIFLLTVEVKVGSDGEGWLIGLKTVGPTEMTSVFSYTIVLCKDADRLEFHRQTTHCLQTTADLNMVHFSSETAREFSQNNALTFLILINNLVQE